MLTAAARGGARRGGSRGGSGCSGHTLLRARRQQGRQGVQSARARLAHDSILADDEGVCARHDAILQHGCARVREGAERKQERGRPPAHVAMRAGVVPLDRCGHRRLEREGRKRHALLGRQHQRPTPRVRPFVRVGVGVGVRVRVRAGAARLAALELPQHRREQRASGMRDDQLARARRAVREVVQHVERARARARRVDLERARCALDRAAVEQESVR